MVLVNVRQPILVLEGFITSVSSAYQIHIRYVTTMHKHIQTLVITHVESHSDPLFCSQSCKSRVTVSMSAMSKGSDAGFFACVLREFVEIGCVRIDNF